MTLRRFILSSILVSATFGMMAYAIAIATSDSGVNVMRVRGLLYLALLPYFLGALINKEGYWQRPISNSEFIDPSKKGKRSKLFFRLLRVSLILLLFGLGIATYHLWSYGMLKNLALVILGIFWGWTITRAWFVYRESQIIDSRSVK
jgi:hypothetical protein